ncbi:MAG: preprotein translocase subunit YajC [Actinobacteria bacterium]|nr:MAG: preprotein translocase subunit YajC [Actinomycetota bacterium]
MPTGQIGSILWLVLIIAVFYFLLIRPQQQRAREHRTLMAEIKAGDRVVTIGGIFGTIKAIEDDMVSLEIARDTSITIAKSAIASRQTE